MTDAKYAGCQPKTIEVEDGQEIQLVMENYANHKTPAVQRWFQRRRDYHVHFTPTSVSWLNQVERLRRNHHAPQSTWFFQEPSSP